MLSQDNLRLALLSAYAIAIHGFEKLIPTPIPWLRFGLANIITLTAMVMYGFRAGMTITLIRVTVGSFFTGTFLGPAFLLSFGAGVVSTTSMGIVIKLMPRVFSPVGISLIGAMFHNITQLLLAYIVFIKRIEVVIILTPIILIIGILTGVMNGIVSGMLITGLNKYRSNDVNDVIVNP
ncbi:heptaprenyl diphosphate synthase component I [bacterium BMS3Abin07]|nr:heptaprenyl diphosphate synthase component I [bacterium BMS3Abin07]GBE32936.1 heptaprenyl diphosphate synthase component I [bacterium BMS3Bbin05]HDL20041.1 Gx transporter family protein [Nitrospirota bacterium]HDO23073.1 Gx transporter family protein [Nitrospirota bacterium]HDZ87756.1 Gx transporter family protein [Nitrospirota bacterium]